MRIMPAANKAIAPPAMTGTSPTGIRNLQPRRAKKNSRKISTASAWCMTSDSWKRALICSPPGGPCDQPGGRRVDQPGRGRGATARKIMNHACARYPAPTRVSPNKPAGSYSRQPRRRISARPLAGFPNNYLRSVRANPINFHADIVNPGGIAGRLGSGTRVSRRVKEAGEIVRQSRGLTQRMWRRSDIPGTSFN